MSSIKRIVSQLVTRGDPALNANQLRELKTHLKNNDEAVRAAYEALLSNIAKPHAQIRISCLQLADYIFTRSHTFRVLLLDDFHLFLQLTVGLDSKELPPPAEFARQLKESTFTTVQAWQEKYGEAYPKLVSGWNLISNLLDSGRLDHAVPVDPSTPSLEVQIRADRLKKALRARYDGLTAQSESLLAQVQASLTEMYSLIVILAPPFVAEGGLLEVVKPNDALASSASTSLKQIEVHLSSGNPLQIVETSENSILFENLRSLYAVATRKHSLKLQKWIRTLIGVEFDEAEIELDTLRNEQLRSALDVRNHLRTIEAMCNDLGIRHDEEEAMDEVPVDPLVSKEAESMPQGAKISEAASSTEELIPTMSEPDTNGRKENLGKEPLDPDREALLKQAPFIEYDDDLYYWDKTEVAFNSTGLEFHHRFLGDGKGENLLSEETLDSMKKRKLYYTNANQPQPKDLKICRYPMRGGKTCPRLHAEVCTFHGKIIPRDERGRPLDGSPMENPEPSWQQLEKEMGLDVKFAQKRKRSNLVSTKPAQSSLSRIESIVNNSAARQRASQEMTKEDQFKIRDKNVSRW